MMKKKSMAVAMAAVTVAMPASQVFAAVVDNTQTQEIKAMKEKAKELMNKKFTTDGNLLINNAGLDSVADKNVFKIQLTTPGSTKADTCNSYAEFERKFDKAYAKLEDGQSIKIGYNYAQEVGYSTLSDGQIVDFKLETYTEKELEDRSANIKNGEITDAKVEVGQIRATELSDDGAKKFEIRLSDDKNGLERYKELKVGDVELSERPIVRQENDYYVDFNGNALAEVKDGDVATLASDYETSKTVNIDRLKDGVADEKLENAQIDGFYADTRTPAETPQIKMDVITKKGTEEVTFNSSELYNKDETRVTAEGNDVVRKVNFYKELQKSYEDSNKYFYGARYEVDAKETSTDQEMTIKIYKIDNESSTEKSKISEIKIVRDSKDTKAESYKAIRDIVNQEADAYKGKTRVAAGADRYETAAEVSRLGFEKLEDEKAIVLVTGEQDKLVDGLTATPLASALNNGHGAPVLLTGNDKIAKPVLDEIERLDAQKVYIVGGAISEKVEKELEDVHGLEVDRISGDDRYETSMEVANEMVDNQKVKPEKVFVVGGKGEADALSAGAVAAKKGEVAPILLTNKDKLSKDIKYFIDKKAESNSHAYVVGGTSSVSTNVYNEVLDVVGSKTRIDRLSGDNRQDTNAKVLEEFFKKDVNKAENVIVTKSDNKGMVDALGAGLYAGLNNTPVVLATNNLTEDQEDFLNKTTAIDKEKASKIMVGNGISSTIAKFIKNLNTNN